MKNDSLSRREGERGTGTQLDKSQGQLLPAERETVAFRTQKARRNLDPVAASRGIRPDPAAGKLCTVEKQSILLLHQRACVIKLTAQVVAFRHGRTGKVENALHHAPGIRIEHPGPVVRCRVVVVAVGQDQGEVFRVLLQVVPELSRGEQSGARRHCLGALGHSQAAGLASTPGQPVNRVVVIAVADTGDCPGFCESEPVQSLAVKDQQIPAVERAVLASCQMHGNLSQIRVRRLGIFTEHGTGSSVQAQRSRIDRTERNADTGQTFP